MLGKLLGVLTRPPVPFVLGVVLTVVVIWFGGHLLLGTVTWLDKTTIVVACVAVVVLAVAYVVLRSVRARQKARAIADEIRNQGRAQAAGLPPGSRDDVAALQQRFDEALAALNASKLGRSALYAMPWFVVIGPPGSGKTTAITESGLNFPTVKGPGQKRGVRGVGGTRNCDWWFTDQAILLDTAGRYTTQAEDHDEWLAFLGMLKKARKQKPVNGALVAISITDVLGADDDALERHAATIRQRIDELVKQLEVVFPVYLMLTKCDLLAGFVESFQTMTKEERAQVWGTTFATGEGAVDERFGAEFDLLCRQVDVERSRLLVADRPALQQQRIFALPLQLRAARRKLVEFVRLLTQPNPYSDASDLRGVYLTSGTQEGSPVDLVLERMSAALGMQTRADAGPKPLATEAKSYFLRDLFTKVMQADKDLARSSARVQRRRELARKGIVWGSAAASLALAAWSVATWSNTRTLLADFEAARQQRVAIDSERTGEPPADAIASLERLRERAQALQNAYRSTSLLSPDLDVVEHAMRVYADDVRAAFLLPMAGHVAGLLAGWLDEKRDIGDYTRIRALVTAYEALDGDYVPEGDLRAALEGQNLWRWSPEQLGRSVRTTADSPESRHLTAYVEGRQSVPRVWLVPSRADLVVKARDRLRSAPESTRAVDDLLRDNVELRGATDADLPRLVNELLAKGGTPIPDGVIIAQRRRQVLDEMAAIRLPDTSTLRKVAESLADVESPQSPVMRAFKAKNDELRSAAGVSAPVFGDATLNAYQTALAQISTLQEDLTALLGAAGGSSDFLLPDVIRKRTDWASAFGKKWSLIQKTIERQRQELDKELGPLAAAGESPSGPIIASLQGILQSVAAALAREARREMQDHWQANVGMALATAIDRFPCSTKAADEIAPADFTALFQPDGVLAKEFELLERLREIPQLSSYLQSNDAFDRFVARVRAIQATCFGGDPRALRLQFRVAKMNHGSNVRNVVLTIAQGNSVSRDEGQMETIRNTPRSWSPGQGGAQLVLALSTRNDTPGKRSQTALPRDGGMAGSWSFLRLLAAGAVETVGNDVKVTWTLQYERDDKSMADATCWLQFEPMDQHNPLRPDFFALEPPPRIFQDDS